MLLLMERGACAPANGKKTHVRSYLTYSCVNLLVGESDIEILPNHSMEITTNFRYTQIFSVYS